LSVISIEAYLYTQQKTPVHSANSKPSSPSPVTPTSPIDLNTQSWKTYTNTEGKYTFKYPSLFTIKVFKDDKTDNKPWISGNTVFLDYASERVSSPIQIAYKELSHAITLKEYIATYGCPWAKEQYKTSTLLSFGNNTFRFYDDTPCGLSGASLAFLVKDNYGYTILFGERFDKKFINKFLSIFTNF